MEKNIKNQNNGVEPIPILRKNANNVELNKKNMESYETSKNKSVKNTSIEYKPKKKKLNIRFLACALAVLLGLAVFLSHIGILINDIVNDIKTKSNIDKSIVYMIDSESDIANIIEYITYRIKDGKNNHAYNVETLAHKIVNLDIKYIDLIIYNAYDNMQYNRTKNMDELIKSLSNYTYGLESINPEVYYKLNGLYSFEDYLKDIGCVDGNGEISLEKYNEYGKSLYNLHEEALNNTEGRKTK